MGAATPRGGPNAPSKWLPLFALALSLALWSFNAEGEGLTEETRVDAAVDRVQLGPHATVISDPDRRLTAEALLAPSTAAESRRGEPMTSFGFSDSAYWFRVPLHNPGDLPLQRLLVFEPTWLDDVRVTLAGPDGALQEQHGGDRLPFPQRAIPHRKINFALTLPPGDTLLLVRVETRDPFVVGLTLWDRAAFFKADGDESSYNGMVYGVLGAMLLYNLILFLAIRERAYGAYVAYVLVFIVMHLNYNGHAFHLLWPELPEWGNWAHSLLDYLFPLAGLAFTLVFLELRTRMPRLYRLALGVVALFVISFIVTGLLGGYRLQVRSSIVCVITYSLFTLLLGSLSLLSGNRAARYFVPATAAGFAGAGVTGLAVAGLLPFSTLTFRAADVGMMIDAVLLSIAMADRLKLARATAADAQAQLLTATREQARRLEEEVSRRTLELHAANITKDKFFSLIAHDLRGPVRSLALCYKELVRDPRDFDDEILTLTRQTTQNTSNLLDQLLTWARSQRGEIEYQPEPLDLRAVTTEVQHLFAAQAKAKGIALALDPGRAVGVFADRAMVHTILRNLVSNALKYTDAGGTVGVRIDTAPGALRIGISDTGVGIDQATLQTLLRLDEKTHSTAGTRNESGSGLGLVLCAEFVKRNAGTLAIESEPGKGSTFWFTLPEAPTPASTSEEDAGPRGALRILVADDDPMSREVSGRLIRELGHAVIFATDGEDAVELAKRGAFDLILMDIDLPRLDGVEAARRVRAARCSTPIVAWSSYSREEIRNMNGDDAFDARLDKPLAPETLKSELSRLIRPLHAAADSEA